MNCRKKISLIQLKSRVRGWHVGLVWAFIVAISVSNSSCKKDNDEYYVKYEVNSSTIYFGGKLNVEITGENNQNKNITIDTRSPWEATIGPVKKGFVARLSVSEIGNNYGNLRLQAQISVSKNSSPFALKVVDNSDVPRTSVQINYTIDY